MKRAYIYKGMSVAALLLLLLSMQSYGQQPLSVQRVTSVDASSCGLEITKAELRRSEDLMSVRMSMDLGGYEMHGDRASIFTPVLVNGSDSLQLDPIGVYGRLRYIQYLRSGGRALGGDRETSFKYSERPSTVLYEQTVPYSEWMNGASLSLVRSDYGCCHTLLSEERSAVAGWKEESYTPAFHYVKPVAEMIKMRELAGRAYVDFPVNRTEIYPDYRNNPAELAKIIATIDSVRNDKDVTVKRITIKGYASPESPWDNNTRLAKGRTATLKQYVRNLYRFDDDFIATDYEPEDWAGLREFVAQSGLEHKNEILAIIDSDMAPDPKEWKIKSTYPEEYKFLLATVYPGLRHSDYTIEYTIRQFSNAEEIREVMSTSPQKLSLNEMYVLAQSLEPGSEEYNEVFETAVRMYPNDETANLNAANAAMSRNDLVSAERYLSKAGTSGEAVYARGVLSALKGEYGKALEYVEEASRAGIEDTSDIRLRLQDALEKK